MADLFDTASPTPKREAPRPLADRLRPQVLADVIGQDHVLGADGPLRLLVGEVPAGSDGVAQEPLGRHHLGVGVGPSHRVRHG